MSIDRLGDRIVSALLTADPRALYLGCDGEVVRLATGSGQLITLVGSPARLDEALAQHKSGLMHIVLVGGTADAGERALSRRWPRWQISRQLAFHQIDSDGTYRHFRGPRLGAIQDAARAAGRVEPLAPEELARRYQAGREAVDAEQNFKRGRIPWATVAIAAACVLTFVMEETWGGSESTASLLRMGANPGHAALHAPWAVLSSAFLHIGVEHLVVNMAALFSFGWILERALGWRAYLFLYVASAIGGGIVSSLGHTVAVAAGASGAIFGIMVGGAILVLRPQGTLPPLLVARARRQAWQPVVLNAIYSMQPGIDWLAHLGGALTGAALILSGVLIAREGRRWLRFATPAAVVLCLLSVGAAWGVGRPWELAAPPSLERQWTGLCGVSLEVPHGVSVNREPGAVVYGQLDHEPMVVEVRAEDHDTDFTSDESAWRKLREILMQAPPDGKLNGEPREAHVDGRRALLSDLTLPNGVTARTWAWIQPNGLAVVRVYLTADAPGAWKALRERIPETVRTAGGRVD